MTLKQGQVIYIKGAPQKVLGISGEIIHVSVKDNFHKASKFNYTESELRDLGYTWGIETFSPCAGEVVWYTEGDGGKYFKVWTGNQTDRNRHDFLGVYPTEEALDTALADIKRKLSK